MIQVPKTIRKVVHALRNPEPEYVSLVNHGAIQKPFRVVKADPVSVARFDFPPAFDESRIRWFMDVRGYRDFAAGVREEDRDGVTVRVAWAGDAPVDGEALVPIELESGVTAWLRDPQTIEKQETNMSKETIEKQDPTVPETPDPVAEPAAEPAVDPAAPVQAEETPAETTPEDGAPVQCRETREPTFREAVARFDEFSAWYSDGTTLDAILASADDGLPIGYGELTFAMSMCVRNCGKNKDREGMRRAVDDYGTRLMALFDATATAVEQKSEPAPDAAALAELIARTVNQALEPLVLRMEKLETPPETVVTQRSREPENVHPGAPVVKELSEKDRQTEQRIMCNELGIALR